MYNNISIEKEKKYLKDALVYIDKEQDKEIYTVFENCVKDSTPSDEMLKDLKSLGNLKEYSVSFRKFVDARISELEFFEKQRGTAKDLKEEIIKENEELEGEFKKRNIDYTDDIKDRNQTNEEKLEKDLSITYLEEAKTKEELEKDLETLKDKKEALKEEKETGEEFNEKIDSPMKSDYLKNSTHEDQINSIQNETYNNKEIYSNPSGEFVDACYKHYLDNETENSKMNVKINYKNNNEVEVDIGYKGTEVNEKFKKLSFNYSGEEQMQNFYNDVYPTLIEEHVIDGNTDTQTENGHLESINSNDETLEVEGNDEEVLGAKEDIDKTIERKKGMIRKKDFQMPNNYGVNNKGIITIILVGLIVVSLVVIFINLK